MAVTKNTNKIEDINNNYIRRKSINTGRYNSKGIIYIIVGIIFWMINFTFLNIDILPDTIGACFVYWGLRKLSYHNEAFKQPIRYVICFGIISILDFYSFLMFSSDSVLFYIYTVAMVVITTSLTIAIFKSFTEALVIFLKSKNKPIIADKANYKYHDFFVAAIINGVLNIAGCFVAFLVPVALCMNIVYLAIELGYIFMLIDVRHEFKVLDL